MRKLLFLLWGLCLGSFLTADEAALELFRYDPDKMEPGTLYSYQVSNFEGENSIDYYVYLFEDSSFEIFWDFTGMVNAVFSIKQDINPRYMVFDNSISKNLLAEYATVPNCTVWGEEKWDFSKMTIKLKGESIDGKGNPKNVSSRTRVSSFPSFDITFFQIDQSLAMRHYIGNKNKPFYINVRYLGQSIESKMSYKGDETINGVPCEKWLSEGKGVLAKLFKAKQEFWFAKGDSEYYLVQYKNYMDNIQGIGNILMVLEDKQTMSENEWDEFKQRELDKAKTKLGY